MRTGFAIALLAAVVCGCARKNQTDKMEGEPIAKKSDEPALQGPYRALASYDFPKSRAELSAIEDEIRKATPQEYPQIEAKLLAVLKSKQATFAGKQFACRMMERVGSARSVPALAALLEDEKLSHMARFALERMPSPAATAGLREGLSKAKGPALVGIITSLGQKRDEQAVEKLSALAATADPLVSRAAVQALGEIGTPAAAKALSDLQAKAPQSLQPLVAQAQVIAAGHLARDGKKAEAIEIFKKLSDGKHAESVRVAALVGWIEASGREDAVKLILSVVQSDEEAMKAAALGALTPNSDKALRDAVASAIPGLKPEAQLRLLAVFAEQRDVNLRPTLLTLMQASDDSAVSSAAVEALVSHGTPQDVPRLVGLATAANQPESPAAKRTLELMGAEGVDEALIALAEKSDTDAKAIIVRTLAARNSKAAVPMLLRLVSASEPALIGEASTALGVVGGVEHLTPLSELVLTSEAGAVRNAAEGAIRAICNRTADKESCANVVLPALKKANTPAAKVSLLRVLSRMPIDKSLAELRSAIGDNDQRVADTAVRELADWPSVAAAPPLLQIAKDNQNQTHAVLALRGYIRLAGQKDLPAAERVAMLRQALATAQRIEEKKQALAGLGDVPSLEALDILQGRLKDADLGTDAASAVIRLAKQLGASQNARMLAALRDLRTQPDMESLRGQIDDGIKTLEQIAEQTQGFIVAWMIAGPYTQSGKNASALFDVAFAPEKDGRTEWRPLIRPTDTADLWLINLAKVIGGGNERVAYLKTQINSAREQAAVLEIGSDDGVKVWVNGKQVHANNAARPVKQGEDKVKINLKQGSNTVLVKVTQGGGDWGACARLRGADGSKITDVQVNPE